MRRQPGGSVGRLGRTWSLLEDAQTPDDAPGQGWRPGTARPTRATVASAAAPRHPGEREPRTPCAGDRKSLVFVLRRRAAAKLRAAADAVGDVGRPDDAVVRGIE